MLKQWKQIGLAVILLIGFSFNSFVWAQQSSSTNYQVNEFFVGPGGSNDLNSSSFSGTASVGDTGVGNFSSTNYQLYGGFTTTDVPYLEVAVYGTSIDMGVLNSGTTGVGSATFEVRAYLSGGYNIYSDAELPQITDGGPTIDAISSQTGSVQGTEQFGINLVANSIDAEGHYPAFGADPVQVPDGTFSFGDITDQYNDDGLFKYAANDPVAFSNTSSGTTVYTASYVMNVSPITEAGVYTSSNTFIVTASY